MEEFLRVFLVCFVLVLCGQRNLVNSANLGGCVLTLEDGTTLDEIVWEFFVDVATPVKDTAKVGDVVYTFGCEGVLGITKGEATQPSVGVDYVTYVLSADKKELRVVVAAAFADYEKNESYVGLTLNTPVDFQCTSGASDLKFRVNVDLSNNNDPVFAPGTETPITLPMPFPHGWSVTTITVTDIDIGNSGVMLTLDAASEGSFELIPLAIQGKVYQFDLKTTKQLNLEETTLVTVTAEDNSQGSQRTATATLTFNPDQTLSKPPSPRFTDALYLGTLDEETGVDSVIPLSDTITFSEGDEV